MNKIENNELVYYLSNGIERIIMDVLKNSINNPKETAFLVSFHNHFSPYSDCNLKEITLLNALSSPFFLKLQAANLVSGEHKGGCSLFEQQENVLALL